MSKNKGMVFFFPKDIFIAGSNCCKFYVLSCFSIITKELSIGELEQDIQKQHAKQSHQWKQWDEKELMNSGMCLTLSCVFKVSFPSFIRYHTVLLELMLRMMLMRWHLYQQRSIKVHFSEVLLWIFFTVSVISPWVTHSQHMYRPSSASSCATETTLSPLPSSSYYHPFCSYLTSILLLHHHCSRIIAISDICRELGLFKTFFTPICSF